MSPPGAEAQAVIDKYVVEHGEEGGLLALPTFGDPHHYGKEGELLTFSEWAILFEDFGYRRVAETEVGPYWVSTVWLGLDHRFGGDGPPIIFETMVFSSELSYKPAREFEHHGKTHVIPAYEYHSDHEQRRYTTEEKALEGHERLCEEVRLTWEVTKHIDPREGA